MGWANRNVFQGLALVAYGSSSTPGSFEIWDKNTEGIKGSDQYFFGAALTCGDFDGNGIDDMASGNASTFGYVIDSVNAIYGSSSGLTEAGDQYWKEDTEGVKGSGADNDEFGGSLTTGDFNGDDYADLAIGVWADDAIVENGGQVNVLYGSATGLTATGDDLWRQGAPGVSGTPEVDDFFGWVLAAGDFNDDGFSDLAIGSPYEGLDGKSDVGIVQIIYGSATGLDSTTSATIHQDSPDVKGTPGTRDYFGFSLAAGDFDDDGVATWPWASLATPFGPITALKGRSTFCSDEAAAG